VLQSLLNVEQRPAGQLFFASVAARELLLRAGASQADAAKATRRPLLLMGAGGSGKSQLVFSLRREMARAGYAPLVVTSFAGVAAAPFGAPTLLRLFNFGVRTRTETTPDEAAVATMRSRFREETGMDVGECGGLAIDEISFVSSSVMREATRLLNPAVAEALQRGRATQAARRAEVAARRKLLAVLYRQRLPREVR
jgi:hypothetical protein